MIGFLFKVLVFLFIKLPLMLLFEVEVDPGGVPTVDVQHALARALGELDAGGDEPVSGLHRDGHDHRTGGRGVRGRVVEAGDGVIGQRFFSRGDG